MEQPNHQKNIPPLVSIVMATYNRGHLLENTIANIFQQRYPNFELIVVNDGSRDDSLIRLQALQNTFPLVIVDSEENLGLQRSLNRGIRQAKGKYIARIDDHDLWIDPEKLDKQVAFLEQEPDFGLVGTAYQINDKVFVNPQSDQAIRRQILMRCPFCHVSVLIRKSVLEKTGTYDEDLTYSEDWDLWLKIGEVTKFANLEAVTTQVIAPETETSLSGTYFLKQLSINRALIKKYQSFYPNAWKARLYHGFLHFFFYIIPLNSWPHRFMQRVFRRVFLKK